MGWLQKFLLWIFGKSEEDFRQERRAHDCRIRARRDARIEADAKARLTVSASARDYDRWMFGDEEKEGDSDN